MSSKASLLILSLIAGAAATVSPAIAATHERGAPAKSAVAKAQEPMRTTDAKPVLKADKPSTKQASASNSARSSPADVKRGRKQAKARPKTRRAASARAAAAKPHAVSKREALSRAKPTSKISPRRARYVDERERALDVAASYAPKTIARLRRNRTIERAETSRASRDAGWHRYVDTYERKR
ncbi:hypothetical protein W911_16330 [Hyphomicrobium nitrativorans NL23]|uniref:Uncharacterized protein n=1 Tax=Hyphomicrobium nitrativorans NL23 TaxID=1029756 RepID=V5SIP4_9HYPH|nr:hypothetical protein [Hyphomicrobium nitrativorans]AHB50413.1 hypothetical protein W911_16330 [Hyphomicrobium nitrativorans NL23]